MESLTTLMTDFTNICIAGAANLKEPALKLLATLAVIELALFSVLNMLDEGENPIYFLTKKCLKYGFYAFLIENWVLKMNLTKQIFDFFQYMGAKAAGLSKTYTIADLSDHGLLLTQTILKAVFSMDIWSFGTLLINLILAVLIFLCFAVICVYIFATKVQFYLIATLTMILLPFGANKFTSFLSERAIGAIFSLGIKIMTLEFVMALTIPALMKLSPGSPDEANIGRVLGVLLIGMGMLYLSITAPSLASDLLSGSPSMGDNSARSAGNAAKSAASSTVSGGARAVSGAMAGYGMLQAAANAPGGRTASGGISTSGTARNLGSIMRQQMPDRQAQMRGRVLEGQARGMEKEQKMREAHKSQTGLNLEE